MNRNTESHFAQLPQVDISRSMFNRSSDHKTSFNAGQLIPLYVDEILPGDTVQMTTSKVVRLQTLLSPIYDNMYMDTYWFFVPNRLVFDKWQAFCGENKDSAWIPQDQYEIPCIYSPTNGWSSGTIADYFGIPINKRFSASSSCKISALPFRAYALICDEFFRDQNLTDPLYIPKDQNFQTGSNGSDYKTDVANGGKPFVVAKYHDYFTSVLPAPQKGPSAVLPYYGTNELMPVYSLFGPNSRHESHPASPSDYSASSIAFQNANSAFVGYLRKIKDNADVRITSSTDSDSMAVYPDNLWAQFDSTKLVASPTVNEFRLAFQLQKFLERNARGGTRYTEILRSHFGVSSPDARLQRPEYLGGNRIALQIHSVSNTAQTEQDFLGDLGAMSVTGDVHEDFVKSFTEHGYLMCVGCVRYDHTYSQGVERFWTRRRFTDFYLPVFANIGEQPVYKDELFYDPSVTNRRPVWGYNEAFADYRFKPNRLSGEMRPDVSNSLASWHLGDYYTEAPTLSDEWIREDKTNVDRVLAVSSNVSNQIFADFYFDAVYTRPMPMYSIPGLIDHN